MSSSKLRVLYPTLEFQSLTAGRDPSEGVPLGWLTTLVQKCYARTPDPAERDSIRVYGLEHLRMTYTDTLTPEEQLRDELDELRAQRAGAVSALPRPGEAMTAEQVQALRKLLGA